MGGLESGMHSTMLAWLWVFCSSPWPKAVMGRTSPQPYSEKPGVNITEGTQLPSKHLCTTGTARDMVRWMVELQVTMRPAQECVCVCTRALMHAQGQVLVGDHVWILGQQCPFLQQLLLFVGAAVLEESVVHLVGRGSLTVTALALMPYVDYSLALSSLFCRRLSLMAHLLSILSKRPWVCALWRQQWLCCPVHRSPKPVTVVTKLQGAVGTDS